MKTIAIVLVIIIAGYILTGVLSILLCLYGRNKYGTIHNHSK